MDELKLKGQNKESRSIEDPAMRGRIWPCPGLVTACSQVEVASDRAGFDLPH